MKKDEFEFDREFFEAFFSWVKGLLKRIEELEGAPEKLKPCPFCGGSPVFSENNDNGTSSQSWYIQCVSHKCPFDTMTFDYPSKQEAAKAWNTRGEE